MHTTKHKLNTNSQMFASLPITEKQNRTMTHKTLEKVVSNYRLVTAAEGANGAIQYVESVKTSDETIMPCN